MFPIATVQNGTSQGTVNVCKTPVGTAQVPIPYPSIGLLPQADPATCALKTTVLNAAVCLQGTTIPTTSGDEPGQGGGIMSGTNKGPAQVKVGSSKVSIEGKPAAHLNAMMASNGNNANDPVAMQATPSQTKVLVNP